jgi:phage shock protein C
MNCSRCHQEISDSANYWSVCGERQRGGGTTSLLAGRLTRSATDSKIAGVCGGIAEYLHTDSTLVRLVWAVLAVVPGCFVGGVVAYIIAWILLPKAGITAMDNARTSVKPA